MPSLHRVGETVPAVQFASGLAAAVRSAGTGHSTFVYSSDVEVDFTIHRDGTDVRIVGFSDDDPESELRVIGDTEYRVATLYFTNADGSPRVERQWITEDLTSTNESDRFVVEMGRASTGIGNPLSLIDGILDERDVEVVDSNVDSTTYACLISVKAVNRAAGSDLSGEGYDGSEAGVEFRIVVDRQGLPIRIQSDMQSRFEFTNWGTAPPVTPPNAQTMSALAFLLADHTPPIDD